MRQCQTEAMASKRAAQVAMLRSRRRQCSFCFGLQTATLAAVYVWLLVAVRQYLAAVAQNKLYEGFVPHSLLEVEVGSKESVLAKAYRRQALKYHPDKNSGPGALDKYLLIRKAYEALTIPEAMENMKTYGNPDGPQFVQLFAVASFIKDKEASRVNGKMTYKNFMFRAADLQVNMLGILVGILCMMLVFSIPSPISDKGQCQLSSLGLARETAVSSLHSAAGVHVAGLVRILLQSNRHKGACCAKRPQLQDLAEIHDSLPTGLSNGMCKGGDELAATLFLVHVCRRRDLLSVLAMSTLDDALAHWAKIAEALVPLAAEECSIKVLEAAIRLQRCILQAVDLESTSSGAGELLQIPHFDESAARAWQEQQRSRPGLQGFLDQSDRERRTALANLGPQALTDVEEFARVVPRLEIEKPVVSGVGGQPLQEGEVGKLEIMLRRRNLQRQEAAGYVHAPLFPSASVLEAWWLVLESPDGEAAPLACMRTTNPGQSFREELQFVVPKAGKFTCRLRVMCESYAGVDVTRQISLSASRADA